MTKMDRLYEKKEVERLILASMNVVNNPNDENLEILKLISLRLYTQMNYLKFMSEIKHCNQYKK